MNEECKVCGFTKDDLIHPENWDDRQRELMALPEYKGIMKHHPFVPSETPVGQPSEPVKEVCLKCEGKGYIPAPCPNPMKNGMSCAVIHTQPCPKCQPPHPPKDEGPYIIQWLPASAWRVTGEREGLLRGPGLPKEGFRADEFHIEDYKNKLILGFAQGQLASEAKWGKLARYLMAEIETRRPLGKNDYVNGVHDGLMDARIKMVELEKEKP